jgi:carboxymethylenebutenolidase
VVSFTHTQEIEWMLPGVAPTGRPVSVAVVVIVGVENGKIAYEHIYWDQATVLVQIGLLDPAGLPVVGREAAAKVLNPALPGVAWPRAGSGTGRPGGGSAGRGAAVRRR